MSAGVAISSNPQTGSIDALGTAVGAAQAGQGAVALSLTGVESATVPVAGAGAVLNGAGLAVAGRDLYNSYIQNNGVVNQSDLAGFAANVAGLIGNSVLSA